MKLMIRTALLCALFGLSSSAAFAKDAAKGAKKDAKAAKPINKICPVEGGEVDPEATITHKGKVIAFCCDGCDETFKKDPAKYLAIIAKEGEKGAKKEADAEAKGEKHEGDKPEGDKEAKGEDDKHAGDKDADKKGADEAEGEAAEAKLNGKCPVSGDDADKAMTVDYKGRTVAFCCGDCAKDFEKEPKKYLASLDAQDKAAAKDDHDHDGDGKADHDEKDHKDEEHDHEHDDKAEKAKK